MLLLAALCIFGTIFLAIIAFAGRDDSQMRNRLDAVHSGSQPEPDIDGDYQPTASQRLIAPLFALPVQMLKQFLPKKLLSGLQDRLILAGEPMTLNAFLTFQILSTASLIFVPILIAGTAGMLGSMLSLLLIGSFGAIGLFLPRMWLNSRVNARQHTIIKTLPDAFDLITTCVEAGLGLDAALARVAEKVEGPFALELSRSLREVSLGRSRAEALKELGARTGVPDLIAFVNAVIQAETMGSSVGAVLRVQSAQLRVRRRQRAEEQAYKAPVKMIFPLVLCIFPTLFIVILGPAVITIVQDFPGS